MKHQFGLWLIVSLMSIFGVVLVSFHFHQYEQIELSSKLKNKRPLELGQTQIVKDPKTEFKIALNDPALVQAWGLKKSSAELAWTVSLGNRKITVAVIDTGCDVNHEDLKGNIVPGWNFVSNNSDVTDNHGHGTHVAGIIGAVAGNKKGVAGVAPNVSIMCLKYFDPLVPRTDNLKNTIAAISYAIDKKVDIINYSGGGTEFSELEKAAIERARKAGILFVAAAGNERSNSDKYHYYPADYGLDNIISVTAIDKETEVLPSSNYGIETVDLAAPGHNIISTLPNNTYGFLTGTSQATPFVTGAAVLLKALRPSITAQDIKKHIINTGDLVASLNGKTRTSRQLNLYKVLTVVDSDVTASGLAMNPEKNIRYSSEDFSAEQTSVAGTASDPQVSLFHLSENLGEALKNHMGPKLPRKAGLEN